VLPFSLTPVSWLSGKDLGGGEVVGRQGKPWATQENEYLRRVYANTPNKNIAQTLGRTEIAVLRQAQKLGLRKTEEFTRAAFMEGVRNGNVGRKPKRKKKRTVPPHLREAFIDFVLEVIEEMGG
jgi:hypothetical protein